MRKNQAAPIMATIKEGQDITLDAAAKASGQMATLLDGKFNTLTQRQAALEHHALYMGIGTMFMEEVAPHIQKMHSELKEEYEAEGEEISDSEIKVLQGLFIGKIFMEIQKGVDKYQLQDKEE